MPPRNPRSPAPKIPSKLGRQLDLTPDEELEIREAWELFIDEEASDEVGQEIMRTADVRKAMLALGFESSREDLEAIIAAIDPDSEGFVTHDRFLRVAALKLQHRDESNELHAAYKLFTNDQDRPIEIEDLQRIAAELKEDVSEEELREMLDVACGREVGRGVDLRDFEDVMKRAGVL